MDCLGPCTCVNVASARRPGVTPTRRSSSTGRMVGLPLDARGSSPRTSRVISAFVRAPPRRARALTAPLALCATAAVALRPRRRLLLSLFARMLARMRPARRLLSNRRGMAFMPTAMAESGVLVVAAPFMPAVPRERRPFELKATPPLLDAILKLDTASSPHRIVAYEMEDGTQFNCAAFDDESAFKAYSTFFADNAISPDGRLHEAWASRFRERDHLPTRDAWLWGVGQRVLSDTRVGEAQIGHGHRFSRMLFRDAAARADAMQAALDPQFEANIATEMADASIAYYGRLVMDAPGANGGWFTKSRYGSLVDAQRGTWLIGEIFEKEMGRWFSSYETVTGSIASTHLVTPRFPDGSAWQREREG